MANTLQNFAEIWRRTGLVARVGLLTVVLACAGAGVLLVNWARQPEMALLFSGLAPEEAAKIVEKVREAGAAYQLKSGGTAIYVPEAKVYSLRLAMAAQQLPGGSQAGYKILDEETIGTSPFTQRINYRRAVEGELAKTIQMLEDVAGVRVHVAQSEPSLFVGRQKETSATVAVQLKAGRRLAAASVAAIVHLVAGSVEGLTADKVVVVDNHGNLLSGRTGDEMAKATGGFLDYKSRLEDELARKAEDMLTAVLGPNCASVRVGAIIETSSIDHTKETYTPDGRVVSKEELKTKSSTPASGSDGKPAPGAAATKEETTLSEYLVSKTLERTRDLPGKVKGLSVAALVDLAGGAAPADGKDAPKEKIALKDAEEIIRKAIGLSETDTIKVVAASFYRPPAPADDAQRAGLLNKDFFLEVAKRSSLGILVIGALLALRMLGRGRKPAPQPLLAGETAPADRLLPAQQDSDARALRARIAKALQENPDQVKTLFLTWAQSDQKEGQ